ncbi:MAG: hypothetical protein RL208_441, partial [Pseudomonadota bacterium]
MLLQKIHSNIKFSKTSRVAKLLMFLLFIQSKTFLIAQEINIIGSVKQKNLSIDYNPILHSKKGLFVLNNIKQIIENNIANSIGLKNVDLQSIVNQNCIINKNDLETNESEIEKESEKEGNKSIEECIESFNTLHFSQKLKIIYDQTD